jgi:GDPmannose 4,6-dehydratase
LRGIRRIMKRALISGISGQDGSYLAELLLEKGYEVHGIVRRSSTSHTQRIDHILDKVTLHSGDLGDASSIGRIVDETRPDEVYNLAAQSDVHSSFGIPYYTGDIDGLGALRMLEAVRLYAPQARFYQAGTSELFGKVQQIPQTEETPFYPRSPYGIAKQFAYWSTINYREAYGIFAANGILFNHESPRRGDNFVTKKIVKAAVNIWRTGKGEIRLGNLAAKRDWGYAKDYVEAMWLMLQYKEPLDLVIATGETHSVAEFLYEVFSRLEIPEYGKYITLDTNLFRPSEVDLLVGDASKAGEILGWTPRVKFRELVKIMVDAEVDNYEVV